MTAFTLWTRYYRDITFHVTQSHDDLHEHFVIWLMIGNPYSTLTLVGWMSPYEQVSLQLNLGKLYQITRTRGNKD